MHLSLTPHDKAGLRAEARALRKRLAAEQPDAARDAVRHLPELLEIMFETGQSFAEEQKQRRFIAALYKAQGSELDTRPLAEALRALDVDLALPVALNSEAALEFRRWVPGDPLEADASGTPAPLALSEAVRPDVIFVPLLAVDRHGHRLGQGGGYYDRTLEQLRRTKPMPWFIGLCYSGQQVDRLDVEAHDERLHGLLTERFCSTIWEK